MQAILFALISYIGWGTGDIFGTIATRKIGGHHVAFWFFLFLIPIYSFFVLIFPQGIHNISLGVFILNIALGIIAALSMIAFYESLRLGSSSLVVTISSAFPAIVVPLSIIFLKEEVTPFQLLSIIVIILGVIICTLDFKELRSGSFKMGPGILLAIVAMISWGIYWTFIKVPIQQIGWAWPNLIGALAFPVIPLYMRLRKISLNLKSYKAVRLQLMANALLLGLATASFNFAISSGGNVAIITPIAGSYPTLYAILSYFIFKDPIKKNEVIGIITTLAGIILLSVFSA